VSKLHRAVDQAGELRGFIIFCPGCKQGHLFNTVAWTRLVAGDATKREAGPVWTFDGDLERPTFSPSMLVGPNDPPRRCHSFVKAGRIQFLSDCHHGLAGATVELPDCDW